MGGGWPRGQTQTWPGSAAWDPPCPVSSLLLEGCSPPWTLGPPPHGTGFSPPPLPSPLPLPVYPASEGEQVSEKRTLMLAPAPLCCVQELSGSPGHALVPCPGLPSPPTGAAGHPPHETAAAIGVLRGADAHLRNPLGQGQLRKVCEGTGRSSPPPQARSGARRARAGEGGRG